MKYYAVTEDPNELMHFGIKGMKWGIIRTPEQLGHYQKPKMPRGMKAPKQTKPRSPAYMRASAKLSQKMRHGIAAAQANWKVYNSPENKQIRAQKKVANKQAFLNKRVEKNFQKHLQLARQGRLKYKGISDDEVRRITDRLALERQSRQLSNTEKPSVIRRLGESIGNGIIQGVGQGFSNITAEKISRGSRLKTQRLMSEQNDEFARIRVEREARIKKQEKRDEAREKYKALAKQNQIMDYGSAYGDNHPNINFSSNRAKTRFMSDSEMQARIGIYEDARKLYGASYDTKVKAKNGAKTVITTDPETGETKEETTYNGNDNSKVRETSSEKKEAKRTEAHNQIKKRNNNPVIYEDDSGVIYGANWRESSEPYERDQTRTKYKVKRRRRRTV